MRFDYHIHFEYGSYNTEWVESFFKIAESHKLDEIGISEHTHTFTEFKKFYVEDLILDNSEVGKFQKKWLNTNKFKYSLKDYFQFMNLLKEKHNVKIGLEVCNFKNQLEIKSVLELFNFDYIIGSVHFLWGWGFDIEKIAKEWHCHDLREIYEEYTKQIEFLASSGNYDILGHPFNIRLFRFLPTFKVTKYLERVALALKKSRMVIDVNTGTLYRYPIREISPFSEFMKIAAAYDIPVIINSDAHYPKDCGRFYEEAMDYVHNFGYKKIARFTRRGYELVNLK